MNTINLNPEKSIFAPVESGDDYEIICEHEEYEVVQAHPYQEIEESGEPDSFTVVGEGDDMECLCHACGKIFWYRQPRF